MSSAIQRDKVDMVAPDIKAVVFDCFGVLYTDSKESLLNVASVAQRRELDDIFLGNNYGYMSRAQYLESIAQTLGMSVDEVSSYIAKEHTLNTDLISYITDHLKGQYRIGLLSNIGRDWIEDFFTKHQLHDLFDEVVLSGDEGMAKPHPEIFELMAAKLGVETWQCLMVDDVQDNCDGAVRAGMSALRYTSNRELYEALSEQRI